MADEPKSAAGLGVDSRGNPVVDPTRNVLDLVAAAIARQDDLREWLKIYVDTKLGGETTLCEAQFAAIEREFQVAESRRVEQKIDTKTAVDAALSAAEKAVREQALASEKAISKSEAAASEQFKQQRETTSAQLNTVVSAIADLKDRVGTLETQKLTKMETREDSRSSVGLVVGIVGTALALLSLIIAAIAVFAAVGAP